MSIFDKLLATAMMGEGGGGGGSSDLSTAEVTITFESGYCPVILAYAENDMVSDYTNIPSGGTATVILYKGKATGYTNQGDIASVSGDIEIDPDDPTGFFVTGNGTIAITGDV